MTSPSFPRARAFARRRRPALCRFWSGEATDFLTGRHVPQPGGVVVTGRDECLAIRPEGDALELCSDEQRISMVRFDAVLLDQGTTWTLQAGLGTIFIADIHYYDSEEDLEEDDGHYE